MKPLVVDFQGGSLTTISENDQHVEKSYGGSERGTLDQLAAEAAWLKAAREAGKDSTAKHFPRVLGFQRSGDQARLQLERLPFPTLTKAILRGVADEECVTKHLSASLALLLSKVYPLRGGRKEPQSLFQQYHMRRLNYLRRLSLTDTIAETRITLNGKIVVNGVECPSVLEILDWLDSAGPNLFSSDRLVAMHGNFHLDNILYDPEVPRDGAPRIFFIDPRGDLLGPPHYDFAKLLLTLEAYYDEVHYGAFEIDIACTAQAVRIDLSISRDFDSTYLAGLRVLLSKAYDFATEAGVKIEAFVPEVMVTECVHLLSLCYYHAKQPVPHIERVQAFLAIAALLARRLIETSGSHLPTDRLNLLGV